MVNCKINYCKQDRTIYDAVVEGKPLYERIIIAPVNPHCYQFFLILVSFIHVLRPTGTAGYEQKDYPKNNTLFHTALLFNYYAVYDMHLVSDCHNSLAVAK